MAIDVVLDLERARIAATPGRLVALEAWHKLRRSAAPPGSFVIFWLDRIFTSLLLPSFSGRFILLFPSLQRVAFHEIHLHSGRPTVPIFNTAT